jgi:hypothetical protein
MAWMALIFSVNSASPTERAEGLVRDARQS